MRRKLTIQSYTIQYDFPLQPASHDTPNDRELEKLRVFTQEIPEKKDFDKAHNPPVLPPHLLQVENTLLRMDEIASFGKCPVNHSENTMNNTLFCFWKSPKCATSCTFVGVWFEEIAIRSIPFAGNPEQGHSGAVWSQCAARTESRDAQPSVCPLH